MIAGLAIGALLATGCAGSSSEERVAERVAGLVAGYPGNAEHAMGEIERIGSPAVEHVLHALWCEKELSLAGRRLFLAAVERVPGGVATSGLMRLLAHWDPNIRGEAAAGLGRRRASEAVPALLGLLDDEAVYLTMVSTDPARESPILVQFKAVEALEAITGKVRGRGRPVNVRVAAWRAWRANALR